MDPEIITMYLLNSVITADEHTLNETSEAVQERVKKIFPEMIQGYLGQFKLNETIIGADDDELGEDFFL